MYTLNIYDSIEGYELSYRYHSIHEAIREAIEIAPGIDPFEIGLGAAHGHYVGQCCGVYITIARLH